MRNIVNIAICAALLMFADGQASSEYNEEPSAKSSSLWNWVSPSSWKDWYNKERPASAASLRANHRDIIKTIAEFEANIAKDPFLSKYHANQRLIERETISIEAARRHQHSDYGGFFDEGRNIDKFKGSILVVGGGKKVGPGSVTNLSEETQRANEIPIVINGLETNPLYKWDEFTLEHYPNKEQAIAKLKQELQAEIEKNRIENQQILDTYYSLNINPEARPDILASITSIKDMAKIPDGRFTKVIIEDVDTEVYLNPNIYSILERITKKGAEIVIMLPIAGTRLIIPMTRNTKWGEQVQQQLRQQFYDQLDYTGIDMPAAKRITLLLKN